MSGPLFVFMMVPSLSAVFVGWAIRHWALAAATACGAAALFLLTPILPGGAPILTAACTGATVAGLALAIVLLLRPSADLWTRMTWTLLATVGAHLTFLSLASR